MIPSFALVCRVLHRRFLALVSHVALVRAWGHYWYACIFDYVRVFI